MALLSWGKPTIVVRDLDLEDAGYRVLPTPVDDSTNLETSQGDKNEAKIEGGAIEDVRYDRSTFALTMQIRGNKSRKKPFAEKDGIVEHNYAVWVQPEDPTAIGLYMPKCHVAVSTSYTANDGVMFDITMDALEDIDDNGESIQMKLGKVTFGDIKDGFATSADIVELEAASEDDGADNSNKFTE